MRLNTTTGSLCLGALLVLTPACGDDGPSGPTEPTPPTSTERTIESVEWACQPASVTVGQDVHCNAAATYTAAPLRESITDRLTVENVHTSNEQVLQPRREQSEGQPFAVAAVGPGQAELWITFDGITSDRWTGSVVADRELQRIDWTCDRDETIVGGNLRCNAVGHYDSRPRTEELTSRLTNETVKTSDQTVLEPGRYREDIEGQPFIVRAVGAGRARVWVLLDGKRSDPWRVTVNPARELTGVDWTCDRQDAHVGDDVLCQGTARYNSAPTEVRITSDITRNMVSTTDASILRPDEYRANRGFSVRAAGSGRAATWIEYQGFRSERWSVTVTERPVTTDRWRGIRVAPEAGRAGYSRPSWNVADTRIWQDDGRPACTPYTQTRITRVGVGDGLDREHIVALAEAWDSRPPGFQAGTLRQIAEDHRNLTLAEASANRSKSDRDAAEWRPQHNGAWMAHRIVEVKRAYDLSVDVQERNALERLLGSGPDRIVCDQVTTTEPNNHPPVQGFPNCASMRSAGWNRGVNRNGGTYQASWDDAERRTYNLNTARDRDNDGHACE